MIPVMASLEAMPCFMPSRAFRSPSLWLFLAACRLTAAADAFDLYEVRDSTLILEIWRASDLEGDPAPGNYQILVRRDWTSGEKQTYLLREGTQVAELPEFAVSLLKGGAKGRVGPERATAPGEPESNVWLGFWQRRDSLLSWLRWPTGLTANWQSSVTETKGAREEIDRQLDFIWAENPHPWVFLEAGLHRSQTGGGLSQSLYDPFNTGTHKYWGEGHWWWHAALGIPGVKWEIALANRPFPSFYWMDPEAPKAAEGRSRGSLIRQWKDSSAAMPGNLSQAVHVKFGVLRYSAHFDGDAYRIPVQEIMLEDLPAPFGPWGFGFALGGGVFTRLRMDLAPISIGIPIPRTWPTSLRFAFLRLDLDYRNRQSFHLNVAMSMALDNPALRWPGASP